MKYSYAMVGLALGLSVFAGAMPGEQPAKSTPAPTAKSPRTRAELRSAVGEIFDVTYRTQRIFGGLEKKFRDRGYEEFAGRAKGLERRRSVIGLRAELILFAWDNPDLPVKMPNFEDPFAGPTSDRPLSDRKDLDVEVDRRLDSWTSEEKALMDDYQTLLADMVAALPDRSAPSRQ